MKVYKYWAWNETCMQWGEEEDKKFVAWGCKIMQADIPAIGKDLPKDKRLSAPCF
jgi:hypothetical protein